MKKLLFLLFILSLFSCESQNCEDLPDIFLSFKEVISVINKTTFTFKESVNTSKSSWIKDANYYSCNNTSGFFVLKTAKKEYIFKSVPIAIWKKFKNADSFGKFYNSNIRNKYALFVKIDD